MVPPTASGPGSAQRTELIVVNHDIGQWIMACVLTTTM